MPDLPDVPEENAETPRPFGLTLALRIVRTASVFVPSAQREQWVAEWHAELIHRSRAEPEGPHRVGGVQKAWHLVLLSLGSIRHAFFLFLLEWRLEVFLRDLWYAQRSYARSPGFAFLVIGVLGIAIGANSMMFGFVNTVLLRPFALSEPDRLAIVWESNVERGFHTFTASPANYLDFKSESRSFAGLAAYNRTWANLSSVDEPMRLSGVRVSHDFFDVLDEPMALGRGFSAAEGEPGGDDVVVLGHGTWSRRFGADPRALRSTIVLDGRPHTIIGITRSGFEFPLGAELFLPLRFDFDIPQSRGAHYLVLLGRLRDGTGIEDARAELDTISARLEREYPESNDGWRTRVVPLHDELVAQSRPTLWLLFAAVGLVLLIASANVASLFLVRATWRRSEMAIRASLGASRARLLTQLFVEASVLAVVGGAVGVFVAHYGIDVLRSLLPLSLPRGADVRVDASVVGFTAALAVLTGIVLGIAPAWSAIGGPLRTALDSETARGGGSRARAVSWLVVLETALAVVVIVSAGLVAKSFWRVASVEPGFRADHVLTMELSLPESRYPERRQWVVFYEELVERLSALPGVEAASATSRLPMTRSFNIGFRVFGRRESSSQNPYDGEMRFIEPRYFETAGIALRRGRAFSQHDDEKAPLVVIVSEGLARTVFPGGDPIGQALDIGFGRTDREPLPREIVGIVSDVKERGLGSETPPMYYVPMAQSPARGMYVMVRSQIEPAGLAALMRREVTDMDRDLAVIGIEPQEQIVAGSLSSTRFRAGLLIAFATIAILLAAIGIHGVVSFQVARRTREIGLRMALGARESQVSAMIVRHALRLVLFGLATGLVLSLLTHRYLVSLHFEVSPLDAWVHLGVVVCVTLVAFLASFLPARRAMRVDPMSAISSD